VKTALANHGCVKRKRNDVLDGLTVRKLLQVPFQDINGLVRFPFSSEANGHSECLSSGFLHSVHDGERADSTDFEDSSLNGWSPGRGQFERGKASSAIFPSMLFMVIETFKNGDPDPIRERFFREGRMLPEGVLYHVSWIDRANARCFQVMEAKDLKALDQWIGRWSDLIDFEIVPVISSQDYWARIG